MSRRDVECMVVEFPFVSAEQHRAARDALAGARRENLCAPRGIRALLGDPEQLPEALESALCNEMRRAENAFCETPADTPKVWNTEPAKNWPGDCDVPRAVSDLPHLLTYARVAEELGFRSTSSVSKLVRAGELAVVGKGRGRRVPRQSLLDYLERLGRGEGGS